MQKENSNELPFPEVFGICRQTLIPIYRRPTIDSALVTQLLFGECYEVIDATTDPDWYEILHQDTGNTGWISAKAIKSISKSEYLQFTNQDFQIVTSPIAAIEYQQNNLYLLPGSRLHFTQAELFDWKAHIGFTGSVRNHAVRADREGLIDIAFKFINAPHLSGGRSLFGFDSCQGFELIVTIAGYPLHLLRNPSKIQHQEEVLRGDFIIFNAKQISQPIYALYLGDQKVLCMDQRLKITDLKTWKETLQSVYHEGSFRTHSIMT
jgi:hypothetical protein